MYERLENVKMQLMMRSVFLSSILLQLKHNITDQVPTAATDGLSIYYNPNFLDTLTDEQLVGLVAHEVYHVALLHPIRVRNFDFKVFGLAADYVINLMQVDAGFEGISGEPIDEYFRNWSTEEVYHYLLQYKEDGNNLATSMEDLISEPSSKEAEEVIQSQIRDIVTRAYIHAEMAGKKDEIPIEAQEVITNLINPKLNWRDLLTRFMDSHTRQDYTYRRINKRFFPQFILPTPYNENIDNITIAIDTSGSVTQPMIDSFLAEIKEIYDTFKPNRMTILDCDEFIYNIYEVTDISDFTKFKFQGGGGTSFIPVLDYAKKDNTNVLIYFTDLYAEEITKEHGYTFETLWMCYSQHPSQPWGETVYYE